jgi:hypothetical protein
VAPPAKSPPVLPDPRRFDPVRFPGTPSPESWPPRRFEFVSPWMREPGLSFERDAAGGIAVVRCSGGMRMLLDIERAHQLLDIAPGTHDFLLLRLVPSALRVVESITPGDPVPEVLRDEDPPLPETHHLYAATAALVEGLSRAAGAEGVALCEALRRIAPGPEMIEQAVARVVQRDGFSLTAIAPLARRLQRLANAHARVLAAAAAQPDFAAMEHAVHSVRGAIAGDRRWSNDLLALALARIDGAIGKPRQAATRLSQEATSVLKGPAVLHDITRLIRLQEDIRDRLTDLGHFWRRAAMAWVAVDPVATDRRDIKALTRNAARRLSLDALYRTTDPGAAA